MMKIPTLFVRDPDDRAHVLPQITPGCEWVLTEQHPATRKWDGTCVMLDDDGRWWARREVKEDRDPPAGWWEVGYDPFAGKRTGWEPVEQSSFAKWHAQALAGPGVGVIETPGTYELVGPKVNGNPEKLICHYLLRHAESQAFELLVWPDPVPVGEAFEALRELMRGIGAGGWEGLVWHHADGRMVKLKVRDFRADVEQGSDRG